MNIEHDFCHFATQLCCLHFSCSEVNLSWRSTCVYPSDVPGLSANYFKRSAHEKKSNNKEKVRVRYFVGLGWFKTRSNGETRVLPKILKMLCFNSDSLYLEWLLLLPSATKITLKDTTRPSSWCLLDAFYRLTL